MLKSLQRVLERDGEFASPRSDQVLDLQVCLSNIPLPTSSSEEDSYDWYIDEKSCGGFSSSKTWEVLRPKTFPKHLADII